MAADTGDDRRHDRGNDERAAAAGAKGRVPDLRRRARALRWWLGRGRTTPRRYLGLDHNPMRRSTDRRQVVARLAAIVVTMTGLALAVVLGRATAAADAAQAAQDRAYGYTVLATIHARTPPSLRADAGPLPPWTLRVAWNDPVGHPHTGQVLAPRSPAGSTVRIWVNSNGLTTVWRPVEAKPVIDGLTTGLSTTVAAFVLVGLVYRLYVWRLDRRRSREWDADWRDVEPGWRHRAS